MPILSRGGGDSLKNIDYSSITHLVFPQSQTRGIPLRSANSRLSTLFGITAYLLEENHRAGLDENLYDVEKFDSKERYEQGWNL